MSIVKPALGQHLRGLGLLRSFTNYFDLTLSISQAMVGGESAGSADGLRTRRGAERWHASDTELAGAEGLEKALAPSVEAAPRICAVVWSHDLDGAARALEGSGGDPHCLAAVPASRGVVPSSISDLLEPSQHGSRRWCVSLHSSNRTAVSKIGVQDENLVATPLGSWLAPLLKKLKE